MHRMRRLLSLWKTVHPGGDAVSEMKTTSLAAFASQLPAWRQQMNWTQVEAADKLGYSVSLRANSASKAECACSHRLSAGNGLTSPDEGSVHGAPSAHSGHRSAGHVRLGTVLAG
jgi:hypothetical protein